MEQPVQTHAIKRKKPLLTAYACRHSTVNDPVQDGIHKVWNHWTPS